MSVMGWFQGDKRITKGQERHLCQDHQVSRPDHLIEENSGTTVSSVSKKLNYLITGEKPTKKKIESAKALKIKIIDQDEFLRMLNKTG